MIFTRDILLAKLSSYLHGQISKEELHAWALSVAVSQGYEEVARQDPLISKTVEAAIDHQHVGLKHAPTKKLLDHYYRCLQGEITYDPEEDLSRFYEGGRKPRFFEEEEEEPFEEPDSASGPEAEGSPESQGPPGAPAQPGPASPPQRRSLAKGRRASRLLVPVVFVLRGYTIVFGVCSFVIYLTSFIQPGMFGASRTMSVNDIYLMAMQFIYAALVVAPMRFTARGWVFYPVTAVLGIGMVYYWFVSLVVISRLQVSFYMTPVVFLFSAVPSSVVLALCMVAHRTPSLFRRQKRNSF